jgi:hypothetical protein
MSNFLEEYCKFLHFKVGSSLKNHILAFPISYKLYLQNQSPFCLSSSSVPSLLCCQYFSDSSLPPADLTSNNRTFPDSLPFPPGLLDDSKSPRLPSSSCFAH